MSSGFCIDFSVLFVKDEAFAVNQTVNFTVQVRKDIGASSRTVRAGARGTWVLAACF